LIESILSQQKNGHPKLYIVRDGKDPIVVSVMGFTVKNDRLFFVSNNNLFSIDMANQFPTRTGYIEDYRVAFLKEVGYDYIPGDPWTDDEITKLSSINGKSIREIEYDARKAKLLPGNQNFRETLETHNQYVHSAGLTHQELADALRNPEKYSNGRYTFREGSTMRHVDRSPFNDGVGSSSTDSIIDMKSNINVLSFIGYTPEMIRRYGFYGEISPVLIMKLLFPDKYLPVRNELKSTDISRVLSAKELDQRINEVSKDERPGIFFNNPILTGRLVINGGQFTNVAGFIAFEGSLYVAMLDDGKLNFARVFVDASNKTFHVEVNKNDLPQQIKQAFGLDNAMKANIDRVSIAKEKPDEKSAKTFGDLGYKLQNYIEENLDHSIFDLRQHIKILGRRDGWFMDLLYQKGNRGLAFHTIKYLIEYSSKDISGFTGEELYFYLYTNHVIDANTLSMEEFKEMTLGEKTQAIKNLLEGERRLTSQESILLSGIRQSLYHSFEVNKNIFAEFSKHAHTMVMIPFNLRDRTNIIKLVAMIDGSPKGGLDETLRRDINIFTVFLNYAFQGKKLTSDKKLLLAIFKSKFEEDYFSKKYEEAFPTINFWIGIIEYLVKSDAAMMTRRGFLKATAVGAGAIGAGMLPKVANSQSTPGFSDPRFLDARQKQLEEMIKQLEENSLRFKGGTVLEVGDVFDYEVGGKFGGLEVTSENKVITKVKMTSLKSSGKDPGGAEIYSIVLEDISGVPERKGNKYILPYIVPARVDKLPYMVDKAAIALPPGGIDLSQQDSALKVTKDANGGVKVNVDPALIARIEREGMPELVPVIINMSPADIRSLFGVEAPV
jgi:hypothetical protein